MFFVIREGTDILQKSQPPPVALCCATSCCAFGQPHKRHVCAPP